MKITHLLLLTAMLVTFGASRIQAADAPAATDTAADASIAPSADEAAIRANAAKYVEAYNRRDSQTMASMWSPDAVYMDPTTNEQIIGRDAIAKHFDDMFAGAEDAKLAITIDGIDFVSPNVAVEKGSAVVTYSAGEPENTTYSAVHVQRDGQWLLDRVSEEETPEPPPTHYEQLKELEWLAGSWVDSGSGATIRTDCEWTKNRNFLTRSYAVLIGDEINLSGMQIIGWDPAAKKIRSWAFDSDGGFGEGIWTHKENKWFIQANGTLADGGKASAVNVLTQIDDDSFTWKSIHREVDGEMLPGIPELLVVRAPGEE